MSPREKHIPADARSTTVALTSEDRAAIRWIGDSRLGRRDRRTTLNDILVDALWYFLEKTEGKTREQIRTMVPDLPVDEGPQANVTEMPKPKNR
jgi:hypothetical protein